MQDNMLLYFKAERSESLLFILLAFSAIGFSAYSLFVPLSDFSKGMAIPLSLVGLIQLVVGLTVFIRTPSDIQRAHQYMLRVEDIRSIELPRMNQVMRNFSIYKKIETALLLIGLFVLIFFKANSYWQGFGTGLFLQALLMLVLDLFAEARGRRYMNHLLHWCQENDNLRRSAS